MLRSAYNTTMRVDDGSGPAVIWPIRWYRAPDPSKMLGVPTAFCSSNWDADQLLDPAVPGENRTDPRTYSKGVNIWQYSAGCHIGTPAYFRNGVTPLGLIGSPKVPACCRPITGQELFLRSDEVPTAKTIPFDLVGNWDLGFSPPFQFRLDPVFGRGEGIAGIPTGIPHPFNNEGYGMWQYFGDAVAQDLVIPNRTWSLGVVYQTVSFDSCQPYPAFWLGAVDATTGALTATFVPVTRLPFALVADNVGFATVYNFTLPDITIPKGSGIVLELGVVVTQTQVQACNFSTVIVDAGPTFISTSGPFDMAPSAFLSWLAQ